ncbi:WD40 repeat-like protein [Fomitiporia mediterranea MF3/22]|uniref:WD40 repeat-like protein n=1 Tax=Fomitiporia mediterranea (strain MF3/22) TaxID=694068 RepID=UPI000440996A|nr:WD40 repeat-like protein [Fomitiporia mediterranea MF3/22]EJC98379.1 WD40 repeat-like protein [Fomitiporia mediterranea MF3/22]
MASTSTATHLSLTVVRASEVKYRPKVFGNLPSLYVQVELNNESRQTTIAEKSLSPKWDERLSFELPSADKSGNVNIRIMRRSHLRDVCMGQAEAEINALLECCAGGKEVELHLNKPRGLASTEAAATLHLRLEAVDVLMSTSHNVNAAEQAVQRSGITALAAAADSTNIAAVEAFGTRLSGYSDLYQSIGKLISKLDVFVGIIDQLSQVHPYVNFTWRVVSQLYKSISRQFEVDKKVIELVHAMEDAFNFVQDADFLRDKTQYLGTTIIQLLKQTNECCLFIQEYASHTFIGRMFKIDVDGKADEFMQSLRALKESIESGAVICTAFVSMRMSSEIDTLFLSHRLHPDMMDAFNRPQCLPGTRTEIMNEVIEWAVSGSDQNVFWLHGTAGSGKSTVSTTIAEYFRGISRLGARLFFERGKSDPSCVIRTLAYKLASFDSSVEANVIAAIKQDSDIGQATSAIQFENLLRVPLNSSQDAMRGPIVIVLDALDECGTEKTRRNLMESFRDGLPELPRNFRFLITSRREPDIDQALSSRPERVRCVELEHSSDSCREDVLRYLKCAMRNIFVIRKLPIPDDWQSKMDRLATAAGGLFIWASTAVKLVDCDNPAPKLKHLVTQSQHLSGLERLYKSVLANSGISFDDDSSKARFSQALGLVVLSKTQIYDNMIDELLGFPSDEPSRLILSRLQSILVFTPSKPIQFYQTSFRDYLLSPERKSDPWFINLEAFKDFIASRCFDAMKDGLRFNICNIKSSYVSNDQVPDLPDRIKANIPPHLNYACLFWTEHLRDTQFSSELLDEILEFLRERLLYWLEAMSLLGKVHTASPSILHLIDWISSHNTEVLALLRDVRRIITRYALAISESTPHIYVSVLPFASMESKFMARFLKPDISNVGIEQIGEKQRSPLLKVLTGHRNAVTTVAFSPDCIRVASASCHKILIWDAESGRVISDPLKEHIDWVQSVAFFPDGTRIVSASDDKAIRIWDVESGRMISGPFEGHSDQVLSVAFSPGGMRIASGSADKTVMIWDTESGLSACLEGHKWKVNSVAFSLDGKRIVSGSEDKTVRIWDVESHADSVQSVAFSRDGTRLASGAWDNTIRIWNTESGQCISGPFEGHTDVVYSVAFSPDGKRVVSGFGDRTVRIWDVATGQVVCGLFEGHTHSVLSVAFSPDGTRVISGSNDDTVRIWDAENVQTVSTHFEGHADGINSVAFSPDGRHIASGSDDGTIRIWDTITGHTVAGPFEGHSDHITSVAFSPDGRRVTSGSYDNTIRIWDVESGNVVSGPLEGHERDVNSVCFSPDGIRVVSGSLDRTVRIWDVESGQMISGPFKGHGGSVYSVTFSPDGRRVASGSADNTIIIWDSESGEIISGPLKVRGWVWSVAFSPDGTRVVSGSNNQTIRIRNVKSGRIVAGPFKGHTEWVKSVAFSPDGARVVSGSNDRTIRVWDVEIGQAIFTFEGHTGGVNSVAFSPDGRRVVSGSGAFDHTIRIWNVEDLAFDWTLDDDDGWIRGREGEFLLWIPPDIRPTLLRARNTAVLSCSFSTRLDFSNAANGERWQECFESPQ